MKSLFKSTILLTLFISVVLFYQNHVSSNLPLNWSCNKTIYEVNTRQFTSEGTFKVFEKHLPNLKEMGVGILWSMPIHLIGEKNRKGTIGSHHSVKNYKPVCIESWEFKVFVV